MINITLKPTIMVVLIVSVALAYIATATDVAPRNAEPASALEQLAQQLEEKRIRHNIPGMMVVIVKDDEVIFQRGFGYADIERETPVTPDTLFAIGSSSKSMTATLIAMLIEEGLMDWDDLVRDHLPELEISDEEAAENATIRDLLSHRVGLGRNDLLWASGKADRETILKAVSNAQLRQPFRSGFQYNNVMYLAAGEAAARAAQSTWDDLIRERLFAPLGMTTANISIEEAAAYEHTARGYRWIEDEERFRLKPMRDITNCAPAGAVNATAHDMVRWLRFQLGRGEIDGKRLLGEKLIEETWSPQVELASGINYGLGWFVRQWQEYTLIEHAGNIDGFAAQVALIPEENIGFAIMMNVTASPMQYMAIPEIFNVFLQTDRQPHAILNPEDLEPYIGEYEFAGFDAPVKALVRDGRLALDVPGQTVYDLIPPDTGDPINETNDRWKFEFDQAIQVSFNRDEDGEIVGLTLYQAGMEFEMPRVGIEHPAEVSRDQVEPYLGTYRFEMMSQDAEVLIQNGRLAADVPDQMVYELHLPDDDGKWRFRVTDQIAVSFNTDDDGKVTSMTLHQGGMEFELPKIADAGAADTVAVRDLLMRMREAYGTAHLNDLGHVRMTGTVDMVHQGVSGSTLILADGPNRFREEIDLGKFGSIIHAVSDDTAWSRAFGEEPDILRGRYRDQMHLLNPLLLAADWNEAFNTVNYVRLEEGDDRTQHVLQVTFGDNVRMTVYIDDESALVVRQTMRMMIQGMGSIPVTLELSDYQRINGVAIPHKYTMDNPFAGLVEYRITNVEMGVDIPDEMFAPPGV